MPVTHRLRLFDRQLCYFYNNEAFSVGGCSGNRLGISKVVVPPGNAPGSFGYQPSALLLSYGTKMKIG